MEVLTMIMASLAQKSKVALEFASSQDWMKPEHLKMTQVQELICSSGTKGLSKYVEYLLEHCVCVYTRQSNFIFPNEVFENETDTYAIF